MATVVNSFSIFGIDGYLVKIEIDTICGQPSVSIVGMGDTAIKEASLVKDMNIFAFNKLHEVTDFLIGVNPYESIIDLKDKHHIENP